MLRMLRVIGFVAVSSVLIGCDSGTGGGAPASNETAKEAAAKMPPPAGVKPGNPVPGK